MKMPSPHDGFPAAHLPGPGLRLSTGRVTITSTDRFAAPGAGEAPRVRRNAVSHLYGKDIRFMGQWEHLFIDGEFMSRARLLSGLTVEQVSVRPPGLSHTIYEELWHTTKWQSIVVQCDEPTAAAWIDGGQDFPSVAPANERMWADLVSEFLAGSQKAVELGRSPQALMEGQGAGVTLAGRLESLAVHNAYHLGKIVAVRQVIGAWPPPG